MKNLSFSLSFVLVAGLICSQAAAAPTPEQRKEIADISTAITRAGNFFRQGKFDDSAKAVKEVQAKVDALAAKGDAEVTALLEPIYRRLELAHALLELEGFTLPPLNKPAGAPMPTPGKPDPGSGNPVAAGGVSFVKEVVPILVGKCGRCHVSDSKGGFGAANYAALMKGADSGVVIFAKDSTGSRLIEVIESGDMPRGGLKISATELATLKKWIDEGALFDGNNPAAALSSLTAATAEKPPEVMVAASTGNESVSFAREIAPVLAEQCGDCHGANQPRNNFNLMTFTSLLKGGDSGAPVLPKNATGSLLVRKLKGMGDGGRMPLNRPALPDATIAKIEKWISEGATFDGPDPNQNLQQVGSLAIAAASTHEELSATRQNEADKNWRLGMPGIKANMAESKTFLVLGSPGEATLADVAEQAEAMAPKVAELLNAPKDEPLIKGRLTLFVFEQRYDYSEFGRMVEQRTLPKEWRGHWRSNVVDAYGAFIKPRGEDYTLDGLLAQQIVGGYIGSFGGAPEWFAEGSARAIAEKLVAADPRISAWKDQVPEVLQSMKAADDFITGKLSPEYSQVAAYSFVKFLMKNSSKYSALLAALRQGTEFDKAFAATFGGTPQAAATAWARGGGR